ncbi:MAG TPA: urea carboxylase-associated family protein [Chloroflexota bacterium]|jgi:hypothetical protein
MQPVEQFLIPAKGARAFVVRAGQLLRVVQAEGPQVCDFNAFGLENHREIFFTLGTAVRQRAHLTVGDVLYSVPPWERVMFTIVADTVGGEPSPAGARHHDLLFGRCTSQGQRARYGRDTPGCQENLAAAIAAFGMDASYVHDPFNIFMRTRVAEDDRLVHEPPATKPGDYLELRAEIDTIVAISACPGMSSGGQHRPLGIEIRQPDALGG